MIRQIPNALTVLRLVLVPFALRAIWFREYDAALLLCAFAGITDALDGFLARRLHARTRFGAYLDPVADKILLSGTYLVFGMNRVIPLWITGLVFGRDLLILLFAAFAFLFTPLREFHPTVWGKVSTIVQVCGALAVLLAGLVLTGTAASVFVAIALGAVVVATTWSAIHYVFVGVKMIRSPGLRTAN